MPYKHLLSCLLLAISGLLFAQSTDTDEITTSQKWHEKISINGYAQMRYNKLFETNSDLGCEQCDKSWGGEGGGFFLRRVRLKFAGMITPRIYFYFQPDFVTKVGDAVYGTKVRGIYFDLGLDKKNEFRLRLGQSKVPYGFENMQSSSQRIPLDRNDALNSALKDERDIGAFLYCAPTEKRQLMKDIKKSGLKHSGDYGIFALGIYNGQNAGTRDENDEFHVVTRLTYPIEIGNQIIEPGIQAYTGRYVLPKTSVGVLGNDNFEYLDQRAAMSFVLYPKPFGIQAEYNIGRGPEFNPENNTIELQNLTGGYVMFSYMFTKWDQTFIPFFRTQYYDGGKKHELDARSYEVNEQEIGFEWQPMKSFELVAMYTFSNRRYEDFITPNNKQKGSLVRLQAQVSF